MTEITLELLTTQFDELEHKVKNEQINLERAFDKLSAIMLKIIKLKKTSPSYELDELYRKAFSLQYELTIKINKQLNEGI